MSTTDKIKELGPWFHQIEVEPGVWTRDIAPSPGPQPVNHPHDRWKIISQTLPEDMSGMSVLDAGCAEGYFAIEMAKRGAHVRAIDSSKKMIQRLDWVIQALELNSLNTYVMPIETLSPVDVYDMIFFIGTLYHLKSPLQGLEILAPLADTLYIETAVAEGEEPYLWFKPPQPGVHQIPKWFPTWSCVEQMLEYVGFQNIERLADPAKNRIIAIAKK